MGFVSALLGVLASLPKLIEYIEKLAAFVQSEIQRMREEKLRKDLDEAAKKAKKDKDTCQLEKLLDPSKQCDSSK